METLTSRERMARILKREPVDRIGIYESFWGDTRRKWVEAGRVLPGESLYDHFGLDIRDGGGFSPTVDLDFAELKRAYGDTIAFIGGLDVRALVANDRGAIQAELDRKLPAAMEGSGYCLFSDHSIPDQVEYDTYRFFLERGMEMGTYR